MGAGVKKDFEKMGKGEKADKGFVRRRGGERLEKRIGVLCRKLGLWGRMRIARRIAASGLASRREAETWVLGGRVTDGSGEVVRDVSRMVDEGEEIYVDGERLLSLETVRMWRFYKPRGCVTTNKDPQNRRTVFDYFPEDLRNQKVVGRLDYASEGLLLVTDNGQLSRLLEHPQQGCKRTYRVRMYGDLPEGAEEIFLRGLEIEGVSYRGIVLEREGTEGKNKWVRLVLEEGKNREIRKVLGFYSCEVSRLVRVGYGVVDLGGLRGGDFEELGRGEVYDVLRDLEVRLGGVEGGKAEVEG
jgi:23S rRNA pseudouridine2605 synthase